MRIRRAGRWIQQVLRQKELGEDPQENTRSHGPDVFSCLPPEIICQIFESLDGPSSAVVLAQTAPIFNQIWLEHSPSICLAMAPRALSNLAEAQQLATLQMMREALAMTLSPTAHEGLPPPEPLGKRLFLNARYASTYHKQWVQFVAKHHYSRMSRGALSVFAAPSPEEYIRFECVFYSLWILNTMASQSNMQEEVKLFLDECTRSELLRLDEMAQWMQIKADYTDGTRRELVDLPNKPWGSSCQLVREYCELNGSPHRKMFVPAVDAPMGYWAFFDNTQYLVNYLGRMD